MDTVVIADRTVPLPPITDTDLVKKGNEAYVYLFPNHKVALRIYRAAEQLVSPDQKVRREAIAKLELIGERIKSFPKNLPSNVIGPAAPIYDRKGGMVIGHAMKLLGNGETLETLRDLDYRDDAGVSQEDVGQIFLNYYDTLSAVHAANVIVGDGGPNNKFVVGTDIFFIDVLDYTYGGRKSRMYTPLYTDPTICVAGEPPEPPMIKGGDYSEETDWYAFWIHYFECILGQHPYMCSHEPKDKRKKISDDLLPLHRLSFLREEVPYPIGPLKVQAQTSLTE